jgi:AbrB family looped-hinge helix DNA binding protein
MKATIDAEGRVVIPEEIRKQAGLEPGAEVDVRVRDRVVEIEPAYMPVKLVRRGRLLTIVPLVPVPPLTPEDVDRVRDEIERERKLW